MTPRPDPRALIAGLGALVVGAAVIAGVLAIEPPGAMRDRRLDEARLAAVQRVATGAQCAYTFTGRPPATLAAIETDFLQARKALPAGACTVFELSDADARAVDYRADGPDHVVLCANFRRPTPRDAPDLAPRAHGEFPELARPRAQAGRHCYRVRLVNLAAGEGAAKAAAERPAPTPSPST